MKRTKFLIMVIVVTTHFYLSLPDCRIMRMTNADQEVNIKQAITVKKQKKMAPTAWGI